jgi:hypothetical protein
VSDFPEIAPPTEVELVEFHLYEGDDSFTASVRRKGGPELTVAFPFDSQAARELLEVFRDRIPEAIDSLAATGLFVTGFAPPDDSQD